MSKAGGNPAQHCADVGLEGADRTRGGTFDFSLVDGLLAQAREQHLRIVFLWLAAWKNGMSSYPPIWVKRDTKRFPRAVQHGNEVEILSTFGSATQEADARAFAALRSICMRLMRATTPS